MRTKLLSLLALLCLSIIQSYGQSTANYTFATGTNGSFLTGLGAQTIDMSTGTTTVIAPGLTNYGSATYAIGFDFNLMNGATSGRVTSFTAATNGTIGLNTLVGATVTVPFAGKGLSAFTAGTTGNDMGTHTSGKVHYKIFGSYPNRVGVLEFLNMSIPRNSGSADATFQVRLYETTGIIEFVYGAMTSNASLTAVKVGIHSNTTATTYHSVNIATNTSSTAAVTTNTVGIGAIANLNSPIEGSRRFYSFTPIAVAAPTVTATLPTAGSMTVSTTAPAVTTGIYGYAYYYAFTPGGPYNYFTYIAGSASNSYFFTGLFLNTTYYWKVFAVSEGAMSAAPDASATTLATPNVITSAATGSWGTAATWTGGVPPSYGDSAVILAGHTVSISTLSPSIAGLSIAGTLNFTTTTAYTLTVTGGLTVNSGGIFTPFVTATGRTINLFGNLNNAGTIDLSKPGTVLNLIGNKPQAINSTGGIYVGNTAAGTPASTGIIASLVLNNSFGASINTPIIVNTAVNDYDGLITTNGNLYIDNTQTYSGGTTPTAVTITRYNRTTNGFSTVPNFNAAATVNVSYPATTLGLYDMVNGNNDIPTSGILNNLTMQIAGGVSYTHDVTVKGVLTMTGGNISIGSSNFTLGSTAAAPGTLTYNSGFINTTGNVTRWFGTTALTIGGTTGLFPIGTGTTGTTNRSFWFAGTPTTGGSLSVKYVDALYNTGIPSFTENSVSYNLRTNLNWQLNAANGLAGTGLSIRMQASNLGGVNTFADVNASLVNGIAPGTFAAGTYSNLDVQANRTGLAATDLINTFYLAGNAQNPLPITLASFTGRLVDKNAILNWTATNTSNFSRFEVERSADANAGWAKIASIFQNADRSSGYALTDYNLAAGKWYYRLKMVDKDNNFKYSNIIVLELTAKNQFVLNQNYPNPVKSSTQVSYQLNVDAKVVIELFTQDGRKVATLINAKQGTGTYNFSLDIQKYALPAGNYNYRMVAVDNNNTEIYKAIKTMMVVR